jgi:hypothetical protein
MLLHKNKNIFTQTTEFQQNPPRIQLEAPLVPKLNLGTRDGIPNVINDLQHKSRLKKSQNQQNTLKKKASKIVKNHAKNVQNRQKSYQNRQKSCTSGAFFLSINNELQNKISGWVQSPFIVQGR